jgi:hypothetical protein
MGTMHGVSPKVNVYKNANKREKICSVSNQQHAIRKQLFNLVCEECLGYIQRITEAHE